LEIESIRAFVVAKAFRVLFLISRALSRVLRVAEARFLLVGTYLELRVFILFLILVLLEVVDGIGASEPTSKEVLLLEATTFRI